jgi:hypothetical protein
MSKARVQVTAGPPGSQRETVLHPSPRWESNPRLLVLRQRTRSRSSEKAQGYLLGGAVPSDELFSERSNESSSVCDRTPNALNTAER